MAFDPLKLYRVGGDAPGFDVYRYVSAADSEATIATAGYFTGNKGTAPTGIAPTLTLNDIVCATGSDGTSWLIISSVSATTGAASGTSFT